MTDHIKEIQDFLKEVYNYDFSGYSSSVFKNGIRKRTEAIGLSDAGQYFEYLSQHHDEIDKLIDALTINVSSFFRNPLIFNYIENIILPQLIKNKVGAGGKALRIWSAGCSAGEEPYSIAILVREFLEKNNHPVQTNIFATDIDAEILSRAKAAVYSSEDINNVRYGLVKKYFTKKGSDFKLKTNISEMVDFSVYDLLDKRSKAPPVSIFGDFDLVLCRNVLIYYRKEHQDLILEKLNHSLINGGYLVLGEAETIPQKDRKRFRRLNDHSQIYQARKS
ncbi:MAG: protein-glutamate O-methyltransferase CheR [Candidatus Electryonea clarkiae]|nr:protein-glutamate O-methyltransferase CheR [Candidatus Electryonea clarkiae]MDP8286961.1 protein-glutamate O-methyltransferase CheR [Candidatus Electryonea clarkiae]